jgi:hypothetical protein
MITALRDWSLLSCTQISLPSRMPAIEGTSVRLGLIFDAPRRIAVRPKMCGMAGIG